LLIVCIAAFAVLGILTVRRTLIWHNELSLWQTTARENPYSFTAYNNLGLAWYKRGTFDKALQAFRRSTKLSPANNGECWAGLAISYDALQKPALAEEALHQAVAREPMYAEPARLVRALIWEPQFAEKLQVIVDRSSQRQ
jgi:tetratricopeptide (TPR) repeat protein